MPIAYDRSGEGPALVLLHPLGADRRVWDPVIEQLASQREVIAVDLPGFGESPALAGTPTPAALAGAVSEQLAELGVGRAHVAGNSLGGWVALELALAGHARSVTAIAPAGLWPEPLVPKRALARTVARAGFAARRRHACRSGGTPGAAGWQRRRPGPHPTPRRRAPRPRLRHRTGVHGRQRRDAGRPIRRSGADRSPGHPGVAGARPARRPTPPAAGQHPEHRAERLRSHPHVGRPGRGRAGAAGGQRCRLIIRSPRR